MPYEEILSEKITIYRYVYNGNNQLWGLIICLYNCNFVLEKEEMM